MHNYINSLKSRLGRRLFYLHSVITVIITAIAFYFFGKGQSGEWFYVVLGIIDKPFFLPAIWLFLKVFPDVQAMYAIPITLFMAGGLQWYLVGWGLEKVIEIFKNNRTPLGDKK